MDLMVHLAVHSPKRGFGVGLRQAAGDGDRWEGGGDLALHTSTAIKMTSPRLHLACPWAFTDLFFFSPGHRSALAHIPFL